MRAVGIRAEVLYTSSQFLGHSRFLMGVALAAHIVVMSGHPRPLGKNLASELRRSADQQVAMRGRGVGNGAGGVPHRTRIGAGPAATLLYAAATTVTRCSTTVRLRGGQGVGPYVDL
jgi:hypothetical protein